jgi:hypothetical protein
MIGVIETVRNAHAGHTQRTQSSRKQVCIPLISRDHCLANPNFVESGKDDGDFEIAEMIDQSTLRRSNQPTNACASATLPAVTLPLRDRICCLGRAKK